MSTVTDAEAATILLNRLARTAAGFIDQGNTSKAVEFVKTKTAYQFLTTIANEVTHERPNHQFPQGLQPPAGTHYRSPPEAAEDGNS